jgi:hypothetical protein
VIRKEQRREKFITLKGKSEWKKQVQEENIEDDCKSKGRNWEIHCDCI